MRVISGGGGRSRGEAFADAVRAEVDLSDSGLALLGEVARTLDALDELDEAVRVDGLMTAGSTGQRVVHPAVAEARQQRATLARLLRAPAPAADAQAPAGGGSDVPTVPAVPTVNSQRAAYAARQRWDRAKGVAR